MRKITLGTLNIRQQGKDYVNDCLENNRLSRGKYMERFEQEFAKAHQSKYALFMNSGTSALQVALAALKEVHGYEDGDEVLVPAITFIATSNIVLQNNLKPVFVDVDPETFNINPAEIKAKLTHRTRAIIPVHLFGLPANMSAIMDIAERNKLQVIEDSCETMFADQQGKMVGSFGDLACFSTYVAHLVVGGVGGIITTSDERLLKICSSLMAHGRDSVYTNIDHDDIEDTQLLKDMIERRYRFERVGYSYRATELEAAIALSELEVALENIQYRRDNAGLLTQLLKDLPLQLPYTPADMTNSFMMYPMVVREGENREDLLMFMEKRGIETRYLLPLLDQPIYQKMFPGLSASYPVAQRIARDGFFIGMHHGLTVDDIRYVSDVLHDYFKGNA